MVRAIYSWLIMKKPLIRNVAVALAIALLIELLLLQVATACPSNLQCGNFTRTDKRDDCNYLSSQLSGNERKDAICILWDQDYDFPKYNNPVYQQAHANFTFSYKDINTSRFILFSKIMIFILFNYMLFSVLTKSSFIKKCLHVD